MGKRLLEEDERLLPPPPPVLLPLLPRPAAVELRVVLVLVLVLRRLAAG
ncbi:hypothetical protein KJJ24_02175 [Synechococcus sp. LA31]|jgi:hypothetical protein|nr:hypothetical protein KJJ24_02175 [Synechococcus sp. LA31]